MRFRPLILASLPLLLTAGKKPTAEPTATQNIPTVVPSSGLYLRNSMDEDPTEYIGGFLLKPGETPDESKASKLRCSSYVSYKEVGAGGGTKTALFTASTEAAMSLGVPPLVSARGDYEKSTVVLVQYKETKKWQAKVEDPGGFQDCCAKYPDQCRDQFIGDFIGGTGGIYVQVAKGGGGSVTAISPQVAGRVTLNDGREFGLAYEFPNEVAFAFKLKDAPRSTAADMRDPVCDTDWRHQAPPSQRGHWEVAVSDVFGDEAGARDNARDHAAVATAKWLSSQVSTSGGGSRTSSGGTSMRSDISSSNSWTTESAAAINYLDLVCTKVEKGFSGDVPQYKVTGLFLLPADEVEAAQAEVSAATETSAAGSGGGVAIPPVTITPRGTP